MFLGDEYTDYNLVFCFPDGTPVAPKLNEKWFSKWQEKAELDFPRIVFHELCYSGITYFSHLGESIATVKDIARHEDVKTTMGYVHSDITSQIALVKKAEDNFYGLDTGSIESASTDDPPRITISLSEVLMYAKEHGLVSETEFSSYDDYVSYVVGEMKKALN